MRLHVVGLPHTETNKSWSTCAYTQKIVKFGKMMLPHAEVIIYSGEENEAQCYEHVPLFSKRERINWYGEHDQNSLWGHAKFDSTTEPWQTMNDRAIVALMSRLEPGDLVLLIAGLAQKPIADALPDWISCEWGVGYEGVFSQFCAFESYAWRHYIYGRDILKQGNRGRWYDTVIPNFFDADEFNQFHVGDQKKDYLVFLGRVTALKGPDIAAQIAQRAGMKLIIAGPGGSMSPDGTITGDQVTIPPGDVDYVGPLGIEERAELLQGARALLAPTLYLEPFGGVAVESMFAGTPVIAPDWGAFTETVETGVTGFRFTKLQGAVVAVDLCGQMDSFSIRDAAWDKYELAAVAPQFKRWFKSLQGLYGESDWYSD